MINYKVILSVFVLFFFGSLKAQRNQSNEELGFRLNFGYQSGINIEAQHTTVPLSFKPKIISIPDYGEYEISLPDVRVLKEDATTLYGGNLVLSYGLFDLDVGFGLPLATLNLDSTEGFSYVLSPYFNASKKFYIGNMFIGVGLGAGVDMLAMDGKVSFEYTKRITYLGLFYYDVVEKVDSKYTYFLMAPGAKLFGELGFKINDELNLIASGGYKVGISPIIKTITLDGEETDLSLKNVNRVDGGLVDYNTLKLGGIMLSVGISYKMN